MMILSTDNLPFRAIAIAVFCLLPASCNESRPGMQTDSSQSAMDDLLAHTGDKENGDFSQNLDLGEDWDSSSAGATTYPRNNGTMTSDDSIFDRPWTLAVMTFGDDGSERQARFALQRLQTALPSMADAVVYKKSTGSFIGVGEYASSDAPELLQQRKKLLAERINEAQVFPMVLAVPIPGRVYSGSLLEARRRYPKVDPLYTLQVGVWGNVDDNQVNFAQSRRLAADHATRLRAAGHEAYVLHNGENKLSSVTIGLFSSADIDAAAGLPSPRLKRLMDQFPYNLVNGKPYVETALAGSSGDKSYNQPSGLVVVPTQF